MAGCPVTAGKHHVSPELFVTLAVQKKVYDEKGEYLKAWTVLDAGMSWKVTDAPDAECSGE